jgi:S1-C subfamily serine protease
MKIKFSKPRIPNWLLPANRKKQKDQYDINTALLGITLAFAVTATLMAYIPYSQYLVDDPQIDGYVQPRSVGKIVDDIRASVVTVVCDQDSKNSSFGTGWAVKLPTKDKKVFKTALITNFHVIEDCYKNGHPLVAFNYKDKEKPVHIEKVDKENDLALLSTSHKIKPLKLSDSIPWAGYWVIALGTADGYAGSVAIGNVLNLTEDKQILITAAISHGNSGGPLLDNEGNVVGVNSWSSTEEQYNGAISLDLFCVKIMKCEGKTYWEWD